MTIKQVIEKLSEFPAGMPVVVHGYEDDYDLADRIMVVPTEKKSGKVSWYFGEYENLTKGEPNAVLIAGERRWNYDE